MMRRFSLALLLGLVAILAVGLAAMKVATEWMSKTSMAIGLVTLMGGTLGAALRRKGAWIGLALFSWAYTLVALSSPINEALEARLPVSGIMRNLAAWMHPNLQELGMIQCSTAYTTT